MDGYKYGDPIPEKYRNRMYDWEGGGYSGNFWEMNQGLVDAAGHWCPLYSSGRDGIDQDGWLDGKVDALKAELGYGRGSVGEQHAHFYTQALKDVFGASWYAHVDGRRDDPRVRERMAKEDERFASWQEQYADYKKECTHRLDKMFMDVVTGRMKRASFRVVGLVDAEHVKDTCRQFCHEYKGNVGMMVNALDSMERLGYEPWCTCTDCGGQFRPSNFGEFSPSIDQDCYTGNGGVGVIYKRVLCDDCRMNCECPSCYEMRIPNRRAGDADWSGYDFLGSLMNDWTGCCDGCADGFRHEALMLFDVEESVRKPTHIGEQFASEEKRLAGEFEADGRELYMKMRGTKKGRRTINRLRDLLQGSAVAHFRELDESVFDDRLDVKAHDEDKKGE